MVDIFRPQHWDGRKQPRSPPSVSPSLCVPLEASSQKPEDKEPIDTQRALPPPRTQKSLEKFGEQIWEQRTENNQHRQDKEDDSAGNGQYNQAQFISPE